MANTQLLNYTLGRRWEQRVNHPARELRLARLIYGDAHLVAPTNILIDEKFKAHEIAWAVEVQRYIPDGEVAGNELQQIGSLSFMAPFKDTNTGKRHAPLGRITLDLDQVAFSDLWERVTRATMRHCELTVHVDGFSWEFPFEIRRWMTGMAEGLPIAQVTISYS